MNPSVAKFKSEMKAIQNKLRYDVHKRLLKTAEEIAENMRNAAPKDEGNLAASIRVKDISKVTYATARLAVKVLGGGPRTLRRSGRSGQVYDYALAIEFGNREHRAQPFFYPTYRRYRSPFPESFRETVEQSIKSNQQRASGARSVGGAQRGGVF